MTDQIAMRRIELDELYRSELRAKSRLVSRFAHHDLPNVTTYDGVPCKSSIDQLVTAALIEAYRLGADEARQEADMTAKIKYDGKLAAAKRAFDQAVNAAKQALEIM